MGEGHISSRSAIPLPQGVVPQHSNFGGSYSFLDYACTLWSKTTKFDKVTHIGKELVLRESSTPLLQEVGSKSSPIFCVPFYSCVHPLAQNYQIWHGNTWGGVCILGQPRLPPKRVEFQHSPILGFLYLCLHPLAQNDQIRHGNT